MVQTTKRAGSTYIVLHHQADLPPFWSGNAIRRQSVPLARVVDAELPDCAEWSNFTMRKTYVFPRAGYVERKLPDWMVSDGA